MYQSQQDKQQEQFIKELYKEQQLKSLYAKQSQSKQYKTQFKSKKTHRDYLLMRIYHRNLEIMKMINSMSALSTDIQRSIIESQLTNLPIIVKQISKVQSKQKEYLYAISNKLKIITSKVKSIESTKFEYPLECYVIKMAQIFEKEQKSLKNNISKHQFATQLLCKIKKNYGILNVESLKYYKIHPTSYIGYKQNPNQIIIFYINFYVEKLLFINQKALDFKKELLYCPITFEKERIQVKISDIYFHELNSSDPQWESCLLKIYIYHRATSMTSPIYTSYLRSMQFEDQDNLTQDQKVLRTLKKIKLYVYQLMVWKWMGNFLQGDGDRYYLEILDCFRVEIIKQRVAGKIGEDDGFRPQIITSLMILANESDNMNKNIFQLKQNLTNMLQSTIFGLIAQKTEYIINFPSSPSSLGLYYYDRKYIRRSVPDFLKQF